MAKQSRQIKSVKRQNPRPAENIVSLSALAYRLELDLVLTFVPLMEEHARGIRLTRVMDLPFAPMPEILLTGKVMHGRLDPMGCGLKNVTFDLDRQVFLADTYLVAAGTPLALVADEIGYWIELGWKWGSYADHYPQDVDVEPEHTGVVDPSPRMDDYDEELMERWPTISPRSRPASFNKLLQALAREMASLYNNLSTAYAIAKTKMYFTDDELKAMDSKGKARFRDAIHEFEKMSFDAQVDWREQAIRRLPRLDRIVALNSKPIPRPAR